jgi:hypothetical protein
LKQGGTRDGDLQEDECVPCVSGSSDDSGADVWSYQRTDSVEDPV